MVFAWDLTSASEAKGIKKTLDLTAEGSWSIFRALLLPSRELGGFTFNTILGKCPRQKTIDNLST